MIGRTHSRALKLAVEACSGKQDRAPTQCKKNFYHISTNNILGEHDIFTLENIIFVKSTIYRHRPVSLK